MQSNDPSYSAPPFPAFPCTSRYVPLGSVDAAFTRVCNSIDARETISLVVGPPGTGKSLICRMLADRYSDLYDVVSIGETPIESRQDLLACIAHQLDLSVGAGVDPQFALNDYLSRTSAGNHGLLILVDEAQSLSAEVVESIRMVTNIMRSGEPCVATVLFGGMKLDELLVDPALDAFTQRIATRCYLHPMTAEETRIYVYETIAACGSEPADTITNEAIAAVHHACGGIPRLINQMLTQAIDFAAESDQMLISEAIIDQAWAELQQLPSPIVSAPKVASKSAPVEFGELDEIPRGSYDSAAGVESSDMSPAVEADLPVEPPVADAASVLGEMSYDTTEVQVLGVGESVTFDGGDIIAVQAVGDWDPAMDAPTDLVVRSERDQIDVEPEREVQPSISPKTLFGDFDEEEEISVGNPIVNESRVASTAEKEKEIQVAVGKANVAATEMKEVNAIEPFSQSAQNGASLDAGATTPETRSPAIDQSVMGMQIEEVLHQEIIGISEMTNMAVSDSSGDAEVAPAQVEWMDMIEDSEAAANAINESDVAAEDLVSKPSETIVPSVTTKKPSLWIDDSETEINSEASEKDIQLSRDDSDMLIVEDELELRRIDPAARRDSQNKTISVDFEAMLARMRSGAE